MNDKYYNLDFNEIDAYTRKNHNYTIVALIIFIQIQVGKDC